MPQRVVGVESNVYIIGQRYYCGDAQCKKTYHSWLPAILDVIPPYIASEFRFHLTYQSGLTDDLVALLHSCFQRGLGPSPFTEMIRRLHICQYEQLHISYLEMVKSRSVAVSNGFLSKHLPFGAWNNVDGYAGFVPSHTYFCYFYDMLIEKHATKIDQHMAMLSAWVLCIDHSFKVRNIIFTTAVSDPALGPKASQKTGGCSSVQSSSHVGQ